MDSFLDADDALHPHAISILLSAAARASAQVATAGYQIVNEIPKEHRTYSRMKVGLMSGESAMCHALFQTGMDNSVWGKIFASTLFNEHLRFRPGRFEDLDIIYRIYDRARRVAPVDATLYYYRKNPEGFMGRLDSPGRFDALEVTDRIIQYTAMYPQRVKKAARARYLAAAFNALGLMVNNNIMDPRLEQECLRRLRRFRHSVLFTKSARRKDRLGALVAYLPAGVIKRLVKKS